MEVYKFLPKVRGGAQRAEGSVVEGQLLYYYLFLSQKLCDTLRLCVRQLHSARHLCKLVSISG